ncbi:hypothetical protein P152DRAFT_48230 [Eremomyces bilateralis CBS 781.70]|uniref:Uncharacterized protein n=1 Tax=Eremomyces bilateralis CBS 781.70 TaxID=1392243 RepID=A0A6G1G0M7_9PEZI|nr:uncharacterized protein P152DRAFT_48230 [Eremomyces bilateralis CBS 781.70]KAF1811665.1 hypothetical protein P152DRAFT_48230 [Eremomyces bilateralis CBS 781.70]
MRGSTMQPCLAWATRATRAFNPGRPFSLFHGNVPTFGFPPSRPHSINILHHILDFARLNGLSMIQALSFPQRFLNCFLFCWAGRNGVNGKLDLVSLTVLQKQPDEFHNSHDLDSPFSYIMPNVSPPFNFLFVESRSEKRYTTPFLYLYEESRFLCSCFDFYHFDWVEGRRRILAHESYG